MNIASELEKTKNKPTCPKTVSFHISTINNRYTVLCAIKCNFWINPSEYFKIEIVLKKKNLSIWGRDLWVAYMRCMLWGHVCAQKHVCCRQIETVWLWGRLTLGPSFLMSMGNCPAWGLEFCLKLFIFLFTNSTQCLHIYICINSGEAVRRPKYILSNYIDLYLYYFLTVLKAGEKRTHTLGIRTCPLARKERLAVDLILE